MEAIATVTSVSKIKFVADAKEWVNTVRNGSALRLRSYSDSHLVLLTEEDFLRLLSKEPKDKSSEIEYEEQRDG